MAFYVLMGRQEPTHSLTHALINENNSALKCTILNGEQRKRLFAVCSLFLSIYIHTTRTKTPAKLANIVFRALPTM